MTRSQVREEKEVRRQDFRAVDRPDHVLEFAVMGVVVEEAYSALEMGTGWP